jgi:hypothetical protein
MHTLASLRADILAAFASAGVSLGTYTRRTDATTTTEPAIWTGEETPTDFISVSGLEVVIEETSDSRPFPRGDGCNGSQELTWTVRLKRHDSKDPNVPIDATVLDRARDALLGKFWIKRPPVKTSNNLVPQIVFYISDVAPISASN